MTNAEILHLEVYKLVKRVKVINLSNQKNP